ncbi:MAG TPA: 2Fe-2S ferredoxin [Microscillaceae bacterium]|jgi:NADH:ubiquinone oxidoreductase subunit E|nr:2Fe-2S ferredoxin [Microscillaceae bacterium]
MSAKIRQNPQQVLVFCKGSACKKANKHHIKHCKDQLKAHKLQKTTEILKMSCTGRCKAAPVMCFQPANVWLLDFDKAELDQQLEAVLLGE